MLEVIKTEDCLYQEDVVDLLVKNQKECWLRENADGNLVCGLPLLKAFRKLDESIVWVNSERYWRTRIETDDEGRNAKA